MRVREIKAKTVASYIACLTGLFPCIFSVLNNAIGGGGSVMMLYLISLLCGVYAITNGSLKIQLNKRLELFVLVLIGILFLSILNRNRDLEVGGSLQVVTYVYIILFTIIIIMDSEGELQKSFFKVFILYLMLQMIAGFYYLFNPGSLIALGTSFFGLDGESYSWFTSYVNNGAFMGIASHYSTSGIYMANGTLFLGAAAMTTKNRKGKWNKRQIICLIAFAYALISTQKRAQLLFSVCALMVLYFAGYLKGNYKKRFMQLLGGLFFVGVTTVVLLQLPAFQTVLLRFLVAGDANAVSNGRIDQQWIPALQLFCKNPAFGIGWRQSIGRLKIDLDVHNIYIQLLCENGVIFGLPIIILMFYAVWKTYMLLKQVKHSNNYEAYGYLMFSFAYQIFFLLYGITGNPLYDIQCNFPYLVCLAVAFGYDSKKVCRKLRDFQRNQELYSCEFGGKKNR